MASLSQAHELRRSYKGLADRWPVHARRLAQATAAFARFHRHLRAELGSEGLVERARLVRMRARRNLGHGAFLTQDQFDGLFLRTRGNVPEDLASLPLLLTLGLMLAPKRFLEFDPLVRTRSAQTGRG